MGKTSWTSTEPRRRRRCSGSRLLCTPSICPDSFIYHPEILQITSDRTPDLQRARLAGGGGGRSRLLVSASTFRLFSQAKERQRDLTKAPPAARTVDTGERLQLMRHPQTASAPTVDLRRTGTGLTTRMGTGLRTGTGTGKG